MPVDEASLFAITDAAHAVRAHFRKAYGIAPSGPGPFSDSEYGLPLPPEGHPLAVRFARAVLRRAHQATRFPPERVAAVVARAKRILDHANADKGKSTESARPWREVDWVEPHGGKSIEPHPGEAIYAFLERHPGAVPRSLLRG